MVLAVLNKNISYLHTLLYQMANFLNSVQERVHPFKITVGYKSSLTHICQYMCTYSLVKI